MPKKNQIVSDRAKRKQSLLIWKAMGLKSIKLHSDRLDYFFMPRFMKLRQKKRLGEGTSARLSKSIRSIQLAPDPYTQPLPPSPLLHCFPVSSLFKQTAPNLNYTRAFSIWGYPAVN